MFKEVLDVVARLEIVRSLCDKLAIRLVEGHILYIITNAKLSTGLSTGTRFVIP